MRILVQPAAAEHRSLVIFRQDHPRLVQLAQVLRSSRDLDAYKRSTAGQV